MDLKKKCSSWVFLSDLLISAEEKKIRKTLEVFCLMLRMKLRLCMVCNDKTLLWGREGQGTGTACWKQGFQCYLQMGRYR